MRRANTEEIRVRIAKFFGHKPSHYAARVAKISEQISVPGCDVTDTLWLMWGNGEVERTIAGSWYMKVDERKWSSLTEQEKRLVKAVKRSHGTTSLTKLAELADVPRSSLRKLLDSLVEKQALLERQDGWYKVLVRFKEPEV